MFPQFLLLTGIIFWPSVGCEYTPACLQSSPPRRSHRLPATFFRFVKACCLGFQNQLFQTLETLNSYIKPDQAGDRPDPGVEQILQQSFPVLPGEVEIANPDFVIFFTEPRFDGALLSTFPGVAFHPVLENGAELATIEGHGLLGVWLRTYHPGYLARDNQRYERVMKRLLEFCLGNKSPM